jgi:hypothetical protein
MCRWSLNSRDGASLAGGVRIVCELIRSDIADTASSRASIYDLSCLRWPPEIFPQDKKRQWEVARKQSICGKHCARCTPPAISRERKGGSGRHARSDAYVAFMTKVSVAPLGRALRSSVGLPPDASRGRHGPPVTAALHFQGS